MRLYSVASLFQFKTRGKSAQNRTLYLSQSAIVCRTITLGALLFYDKTRTFAQGIK